MPLTASTAPSASRRAAAQMASSGAESAIGDPSPSSSCAAGPQAGHAFGWAWKRRSPGSWYSRRDASHDREAGPAVRAVDERVAEAAITGIAQLRQAVVAGRLVVGDERVGIASCDALDDAEVALARRGEPIAVDALDDGERWRLAGQAREEALDGGGLPVDLQHHPALVI